MTAPEAPKTSRRRDRLVGELLAGKYRIAEKIGEGGMGAVYVATQEPIDRKVAVKVLLGKLAEDEISVKRFEQEARAISKMQHPNTVTIYDFGRTYDESDGRERLYIVMEYLKGRTLTQVLRKEGQLPGPRAARIVRQVCASLADAHHAGIIHRDLKPDNIFLTEVGGDRDWVKVLDFGVAKLADSEAAGTLTQTGMIFGTPKYMSPEQAEGRPIDYRADIYALGVVLFELLAGRPPFVADTPVGLLLKHIQEEPPSLGQLRPDLSVDPRLEAVVMKALAKAPEDRFDEVSALAAELEAYERSASGGYAVATGTVPTPMSSGLPTEVVGQGPQYTPAGLRSPSDVPPDLSAGLGDRGAGGATYAPPTVRAPGGAATQRASGATQLGGDTVPQALPEGAEVSEGLPVAPQRSAAPVIVALAAVVLIAAAGFAYLGASDPASDGIRTTALPENPPSSPGEPTAPEEGRATGSAAPEDEPSDPPSTEGQSEADDRATESRGSGAGSPTRDERSGSPADKSTRTPVLPARVDVRFDSKPRGAVVLFEGEQIGLTPFTLPIDRGRTMEVTFRKAGFQPQRRTFRAGANERVSARLAPAEGAPSEPAPVRTDTDKVSDLK